jgi:subtilisin family serine protease
MRLAAFFIFFSLINLFSFAQSFSKYWVEFTDKNNSVYSLNTPSAFLSQKAIDRRIKQNISIVENDLPVNQWYIDSIVNSGSKVLNRSKWFNAVSIYTTDTVVLNKIKSFSFVKSTSTVAVLSSHYDKNLYDKFEFERQLSVEEDETDITTSSGYNYGSSSNQISMIGGDVLHSLGYSGEGMVIAVIDAGFKNVDIMEAFDSLWANQQILGTWDFVQNDKSVYEDDTHGMMVLSTMGGNLPAQLVGTAPKASYWLLRSEDSSSEYPIEEDNWAAAAEFADSVGADVINSSLGYSTFDNSVFDYTYADMNGNSTRITKAADLLASKGVLVVSSAGNEGNGSWHYITAPADGDSVLCIGAVDANGSYASFSATGPTYDGRIKPNVATQGSSAIVASAGGGIQSGSGTSFASPIMAGAAACLWQAHPAYTNIEIMDVIQKSASQYANPDSLLGYGIPNLAMADLLLSGVAVVDYNLDELLKVFPLPFNDKINVWFYSSSNQDVKIQIVDLSGRIIYSEQKNMYKNSYNPMIMSALAGLSHGIYIFNLMTEEKYYTRKMMKY